MRGTRFVLVVGLVVAAFALAGCGGDDNNDTTATETDTTATETDTTATETTGEAGGTLIGTVGPGFTITLTMEDGASVTTLAPGDYTVEIDDQSDIHNFHLSGPGVDSATEVSEIGKVTWNVTLETGTYTYVCDPHSSQMMGSFEVTG
jgi:plastocyanin